MRQAIHIFIKDFRYVRAELGVVLSLAVLYAWVATRVGVAIWAEALLDIGAAYLIARLIQAEALPGDKQFWLTRPYNRWSLVAAKLLGLLLLANVPIFAARLYVLLHDGFPFHEVILPLLWSQALLYFAAMLPVAAFASVTIGIAPFTFGILGLAAITLATFATNRPPARPAVRLTLNGTQWVWDSIVVLALIAIGVAALSVQYRTRRTWVARAAIAVIAFAGIAAYLYLPWTTAAAIQTAISKQRLDPNTLQVVLTPATKQFYSIGMMGRKEYQVAVPVSISGVPPDVELIPDAISLRFDLADGTTWSSGPYIMPALAKDAPGPGPAILNANVDLPAGFTESARRQKVALHADLYLTLFGNAQSKTIRIHPKPVDALDTLRCQTGAFRQLTCMAPFGWPNRLLYAKFASGGELPFTRFVSYSPFPAGIAFDEVASRSVTYPNGNEEVTIISHQPLGSYRRHFTIDNFPMAELSIQVQRTTRTE